MKTPKLISVIATIGIIVFFAGVYLTVEHQSYGTTVQFLGIGAVVFALGPALISKSYDFLVRRKGSIDQKHS